jgi:hypothetical protein
MRIMLPGRMAAHEVTASRSAVHRRAALHNTAPHSTAPHRTAPRRAAPRRAAPRRAADLPAPTTAQVSKEKCRPEAVGVHTDSGSVTTLLETISKSRERLSDPRLLGYTEIVHPMVMMRQRNKGDFMDVIAWDYYTARLPQITFPPFRWDASLFLNMTFKIDPNDILQATQMFNSWPPAARPKLSYNLRDNHNNVQVWIVQASFGASVRAYRISNPDAAGVVTVEHVKKVVLETSYDAMDVPATEVQTDVAAADYNKGQPVFKKIMVDTNVSAGEKMQVSCEQYFNLDAKCRQTIYVPRVHKVSAVEYAELYKGTWPGARTGLASPPVVELSVEVRDLQQPRPYSPEFVGFGQPFFVGFGFLISAVLLLFLWMGLRFYVVNKHVRENEGKPPMFYQGMLRFRGW